jgi:AraC-like DNA-binding protein
MLVELRRYPQVKMLEIGTGGWPGASHDKGQNMFLGVKKVSGGNRQASNLDVLESVTTDGAMCRKSARLKGCLAAGTVAMTLMLTTVAGSAPVDTALALVEDDLGPESARAVAKLLIVYHRRAGGQSQFSTLLNIDSQSDRIQAALTYAINLNSCLSVAALAKSAFLSPRQFSGVFREKTGWWSPAKAIERLRVESARLMMEAGRFSAEEIARKNGFGSRERLQRSFVRAFGQSPQAIQRTVSALSA